MLLSSIIYGACGVVVKYYTCGVVDKFYTVFVTL